MLRLRRKDNNDNFGIGYSPRFIPVVLLLLLMAWETAELVGQDKAPAPAPASKQQPKPAAPAQQALQPAPVPAPAPAPAPNAAAAPAPAKGQPVSASLYYPDLEPKQLFQILQGTFQVQFQGTESVKGPISLISKEKIDVAGMIKLLNAELAKQDMAAERQDQTILLRPAKGLEDETIPIQHGDPSAIISILKTRFMSEELDDKERVRFIEVHPQGKSIVVRGPKAVLENMKKYINEHLDKPAAQKPAAEAEIRKEFDVKYITPQETVDFLKEVYLAPAGTTAKEGDRFAKNITAHPKLPKIIVTAPAGLMPEIEKTITEIDVAPPVETKPLFQEYITLDYIAAIEFNYILRNDESLTVKGSWLFASEEFIQPAALLRKLRDPQDALAHHLQQQLSEKIQRMLKDYQGSDPPPPSLKTALVLEFNRIIQGSTLYDEKYTQHLKPSAELKRLLQQIGPDSSIIRINRMILETEFDQEIEAIKYKFRTSIAPNNILIISSSDQKLLKSFTALKNKLDVDRKELRYIPLSYADATEVADMIQKIYPKKIPNEPTEMAQKPAEYTQQKIEESILLTEAAGAQFDKFGVLEPTTQERLSQALALVSTEELLIVPDKTRNYLMIYTYSRNFPKILELIQELDKPQKQVYIDVYIAQVNLEDALKLGAEFTYNNDFTRKGENIPYTAKQDFGVGDLISTGLNYEFISANLSVFLHALQTKKNVDIMARPSILVKNGKQAVISLGRGVPLIQTVQVNITGLTQSNIIYQDVTTKLEVTPQIHPDNYVSLVIKQTIDDVSAETFQISEDFNPQVILRRQADTELRVKDGQTICLGGFIVDDITTDEHKVPLLGDIPLLGYLFKYSSHERTKRELIIFISPYILATPYDIKQITNAQRRMTTTEVRDDRFNKEILAPQTESPSQPLPNAIQKEDEKASVDIEGVELKK